MWVILRLLTAIGVGLYRFYRRRTRVQSNERSERHEWVVHVVRKKSKVVSRTFGVAFKHPVFLRLSRERGWDRFFKAIGYSCEFQSGDEVFDREIYIACDHPAIAPWFRDNGATRTAVLDLFERGATVIYSDGANLWARLKGDLRPDDAMLTELETIRDGFKSLPAYSVADFRDRFFWKALAVGAVAWSIAWYGVPAILENSLRSFPLYFDWAAVVEYGLAAGGVIGATLIWLAWLILRGSSRTHRIFVESALVLALGVPLSSIELVSDANRVFDHSAATIAQPVIVAKYTRITRTRHGRRTHYHIVVNPPSHSPARIARDIEVASSIYYYAGKNKTLRITLRSGALGLPWVEDIRVDP